MYVKMSDFFMGMGKQFTMETLDIAEKLYEISFIKFLSLLLDEKKCGSHAVFYSDWHFFFYGIKLLSTLPSFSWVITKPFPEWT